MSRTLYLLRHGQTRYNAELRLQGRCNSELTAKGEAQALAMGARLAQLLAEPADWTLYASPLGRARQTAERVCQQLGLDQARIVWDERLVELGMGEWESRRVPELLAAHPELDLEQPDWYLQAPEGESFQSIQGRALSWLQDEQIAERAIVVSHGLFGAMLRGAYADLDYTTTWLQELPQDAFFKLSGGRIERIPC
ncbi:histidine phosphatase family protein [Aeromonas dhakensis]|uniref:histidine phosphatase family protein n=1 Tax=Aeromonas dhakensis TaxID=196024 RepID=UPI0006CA1C4E|nr:histidine phosphatase family protein [Aeromonas dhakensis]MBO2899575.1 histidine phosphatase family protein [Aeromonas dhakensis]MBO2994060.1 histidine phosphatase family protein [Aeromonas dhakensis]MCR6737594.1 phosphoglycerate mutase family protein [Aeromonas dhakensis]MDX7695633.1 histidine phosphatase family protein [Aeromonas dhakensis]RQM79590.1 histidine phosphatase family protein [Aeromonas dhakensis]